MDIAPTKNSIKCITVEDMAAVIAALSIHGIVWQAAQYDGYWLVNVNRNG